MQAIIEGAALRVRPKAMTVAVIIAGLLPIMWGSGTGPEVMRRIAAPRTETLLGMLRYGDAAAGHPRAGWQRR
ncbi:MAG TPA: hypothetical protein VMQ50_17025 [Casimicrobiaceae bacterium]|nr:hypothetical protein [Casimicrobiaceae bacterium]